ncbi:disease resistance protein RPP8-like isoform X2 [Gossypium australe]|uniref:Disease resistance protein RPP8-like isoform X2 n=1 Tax=Gossypium australe TaxID=47621 RepID=A0A5B6WLH7_9ROSI|nr:disease resistance protein RPP8-like isoform X2 [Gossypium australe]
MLMENVGKFFLEELIGRSLVQVARRDYTGRNVKTCRIHDLLRDLCIEKAREEKFLEILQAPLTECNVSLAESMLRRIAIHPCKRDVCLKGEHPKLRSLTRIDNTPLVKMQIYKFLRVLNLVRQNVGEWHVSSETVNLHHLRYLKLKGSKSRMNRALHWQPRYCSKNIETLKYIMVDKMFIENNELLRLANIQCLGIEFKRSKGVKPILMSLIELHPLVSLYMELVDIIQSEDKKASSLSHYILKFLPLSIVKLTLCGCRMKPDPMRVLEKLPRLRIFNLYFKAYMGSKMICSNFFNLILLKCAFYLNGR